MTIYKLEKVNKEYKSYNSKTLALKNINLVLNEGEIIVILGPSGSGKSTLLNVLSGIDKVTSGRLYFDNNRIDEFDSEKLRIYRKENIGFIFQSYNLVSNLTVYENVELGHYLATNPINIMEILEILDITKLKDKYPKQLSGGEMQRVSIARAIVKNSKVLFCDEPTGALDEKTGKKILELLQKINKKYKTTIIIVTHNPSIADMANTVIKMNSGKIVSTTYNETIKDANELGWA